MKSLLTLPIAALALSLVFVLGGCASTGQADKAPLDPAAADVAVEVKGMSCPQCANNLKLIMDDHETIADSRVDLGSGQVYILFVPEKKLDDAQIGKLVEDSGFTPGEVKQLKKKESK